ncbi:MAG: hypothetical protein IT374_14465 [Polyangiaceae bacterium]|nr:hypothetical protein [Polyangiaceae bacterium]
MIIKGAEALGPGQLSAELARGAKIVVFEYCVSLVVVTFKRSSAPHLVRPGQSTLGLSLPYTLLSLAFGWWGIPWGFIYTPMALFTNLSGGRDVTAQVLA